MSRAAKWVTERCRTRLDVLAMFGLGYALGSGAAATWWGRALILVCAMGVTDMAATLLERLVKR